MIRKECIKYYFSVEGETEKWYLEWLENQINDCPDAKYRVKFDVKVMLSPKKRVKQISVLDKTEILHVFDFEEPQNEGRFQNVLSFMKEASSMKRNIKYKLGYCNYTFDLWIILHKERVMGSCNHRSNYLSNINRCYGTSFESMPEYKEEDNFKRILSKLTLDDVKFAIKNAEKISSKNEELYQSIKYCGYEYYRENPSLNLHTFIRKVLEYIKIL